MENFTFQLSGVKKWHLKRSGVTEAIRGLTPHYKDQSNAEQQFKSYHHINPDFVSDPNEIKDEEVITLYPGDCLYFPSGHWHKVECLEDSVSINVQSLFFLTCIR
jgi:ribosomal protein L16 Arg81 hydroxylase